MSRRLRRPCDRRIKDLSTHEPPLLTRSVLAAYLGVDERAITRLIVEKTLHAFKVGREWRIPTHEARRVFPVRKSA